MSSAVNLGISGLTENTVKIKDVKKYKIAVK